MRAWAGMWSREEVAKVPHELVQHCQLLDGDQEGLGSRVNYTQQQSV